MGEKVDGRDAPGVKYAAVTASDSVNYSEPARALYVGVAGDVVVVGLDGTAVTFSNLPVGIHPLQHKRINATNTTATNMVAIF